MDLVQCGVCSDAMDVVAWPAALEQGFTDCDVSTFIAAAEIVSSGKFCGPRVATLMERLAIRLEAADELGDCSDFALAESAFNAIVAQLENDLQLPTTSIRDEVRELHLISVLYGDARQPPNGAVVKGLALPINGYFSVAGGALAIPTTGKGNQVDPLPEQVVVTQSIYRALLAIDVMTGEQPCFPLAKARDGVYEFVRQKDVSAGCESKSLPQGLYRLPGGAGCLVGRDVVKSLLDAIWVAPDRERRRGFCYLRVVPPLMRGVLSRALGAFPTVAQIVDVCADVYTWSPVEARVFPVSDGKSHDVHYHVASFGRLPLDIPQDAKVGADTGGEIPGHFNNIFQSFERRLSESSSMPSGFSSRSSSTQRHHLPSPPRSSVSHLRSVSVGASAFHHPGAEMVQRSQTPVFQLQPGAMRAAGPVWTEFTDPRAREWANRMASGPPLGNTALRSLCKATLEDLPELPVAEGGRMVALPGSTVMGAKQATWKNRSCPIPGWTIECMGATSAPSISAVPPRPGVICRYEISSERPFEINGALMPEYRTALWIDGNILITRLGRHAAVWRLWHEAGAAALGVDFMSLHIAYQCPTIVPARRDRTQIVCARLTGEDQSRGEQLYQASVPSAPGEAEVHIYVADSLNTEPVVLAVTSPGLVQIMIHGVVVSAYGTTAMCVTDLSSLTVRYCIANDRAGRKGRVVNFEIRRTKGIGVSRGRAVPATHLLPSPSISGDDFAR